MKVLDLFSGIGGFSLGLESTGFFETTAFCEKDAFCKKVLQKHWPSVKIYNDIREVKNEQADVVTGGFPCQPFSQAGKRTSRDDDRFLWNEMFDVIKQTKPRWVIGENVQGIINIEEGMVLKQVQDDLGSEGFDVQSFIIPASSIGAWHERKRVWILAANSEHNGLYRQKGNETIKSSNKQKNGILVRDDKNVSNSKSIRHGGRNSQRCSGGEWSFFQKEQEGATLGSETKRCSDASNTDVMQLSNLWRQQQNKTQQTHTRSGNIRGGFRKDRTWWETESEFCGVPDGVSKELDKNRVNRIKSLGNSVVPLIVRQFGLAIIDAEKQEHREKNLEKT